MLCSISEHEPMRAEMIFGNSLGPFMLTFSAFHNISMCGSYEGHKLEKGGASADDADGPWSDPGEDGPRVGDQLSHVSHFHIFADARGMSKRQGL